MQTDQQLTAQRRTGSRKAAFTLLLLTPLVAELAFSTPLRYAYLVLLWLPIYGGGVLLIRELVARSGRGWPSIVVLGIAYEIVEDGIGLQALSSPHLYHAADWGARVLGINLPYWEVNAFYHVVFSATIPILLTNLLFPAHRHVPYLRKTGLVVTALVAVLGVGLLRVSVPPTEDPGYLAPLPVLVGCVVAVVVLAVIALRVIPRRAPARPSVVTVPAPLALALLGMLGVVAVLGMLYPMDQLGARQPSFTHGWWVLVPMLVAAALCVFAYGLVRRWSSAGAWTDLHALGLAGGALVAHTLVAAVGATTTLDRVGLVVIAVVTAVLCLLAARPMSRRTRPAKVATAT